jgi:glycosyltransferase involved in cell wall biosynthesis
MAALPISVCLVSGAEEQRIARCLASVAGWTSEIIVVLNEEVQDRTATIVADFGGRVFRHPWQGFREQKNLALTYASQPWVLSLDADEVVSPALRIGIEAFLAAAEPKEVGARFPRLTWFMGRWITHGDWYPDHVLRLFRRGAGRWGGSPEHTNVELTGAVRTLRGDLLHYSNPSINGYLQKIPYYADLYLQRQLAEGTRWRPLQVIARAAWRFLRAYFLKRGFLDGYPGFFLAVSTAYAALVRHTRLYEHLNQRSPPDSPSSA